MMNLLLSSHDQYYQCCNQGCNTFALILVWEWKELFVVLM